MLNVNNKVSSSFPDFRGKLITGLHCLSIVILLFGILGLTYAIFNNHKNKTCRFFSYFISVLLLVFAQILGFSRNCGSILFFTSVVVLCCGIVVFVMPRRLVFDKRISFETRGVIFLLLLLFSTFLLRFFVGRINNQQELSILEEIADSLLHTFQSFSMDEEYTAYLVDGKAAVSVCVGQSWVWLYSLHNSLIGLSCAVSGGAIIYSIAAKFFPQLALKAESLKIWKPVCYFSALNAESLALAKSIRDKSNTHKNSIFVFCNTDAGNEKADTDLIEQAKDLGSVLLKKKLSSMKLLRRDNKRFFLIDDDESNLSELSDFTDEKKYSRFRAKDEIYVFSDENYETGVEKIIQKTLEEKAGLTLPVVFNVNKYRSLVFRLLMQHPLYTAVDPACQKMHVVIFGTGKIGTEAFLDTYWCGQMLCYNANRVLSERQLAITVVSNESKASFDDRINHINNDILVTADEGSDILKSYYYKCNSSYFAYKYFECDLNKEDLGTLLEQTTAFGRIMNADYYIVALGSDEENMGVANDLRRIISAKTDKTRIVPIVCAIYNSDIADVIKTEKNDLAYNAEVIPFGELTDMFDCSQVFFEDIMERAKKSDDKYLRAVNQKINDKKKLASDPYTYWANIARAIHGKYKARSLNLSINDYYKMCSVRSCLGILKSTLQNNSIISYAPQSLDDVKALYESIERIPPAKNNHPKIKTIETFLEAWNAKNEETSVVELLNQMPECLDDDSIESLVSIKYIRRILNDNKYIPDDKKLHELDEKAKAELSRCINSILKQIDEKNGKKEASNQFSEIKSFVEKLKSDQEEKVVSVLDGFPKQFSAVGPSLYEPLSTIRKVLIDNRYENRKTEKMLSNLEKETAVQLNKYIIELKDELEISNKLRTHWYTYVNSEIENKEQIDSVIHELNKLKTAIGNSEGYNSINQKVDLKKLKLETGADLDALAWLEHRRWNAFMRICGFRCPSLEEENRYISRLISTNKPTGNTGNHKSIVLKLHPCIVECKNRAIVCQKLDDLGEEEKALLANEEKNADDSLDEVTNRFKKSYTDKGLNTYDFKKYDYPEFE